MSTLADPSVSSAVAGGSFKAEEAAMSTASKIVASDSGWREIDAERAQWIDAHCNQPADVSSVLVYLAELSMPRNLSEPSLAINPMRSDVEAQFWPWNRAAGRLASGGHAVAAATVWAGSYLAFLSLQQSYRQRYAKATALNNLGFALGSARRPTAIVAWFLGLAEDAISDFASCREKMSYKNLAWHGIARPLLDQFVSVVDLRFNSLGIVPVLPDAALYFLLNPTRVAPGAAVIRAADQLIKAVSDAYPALPESPLDLVEECWKPIALKGILD